MITLIKAGNNSVQNFKDNGILYSGTYIEQLGSNFGIVITGVSVE